MSEELGLTPPNSPGRPVGELDRENNKYSNQDIHNDPAFSMVVSSRCFSCLGEAKLEKIVFSDDSYYKNNEILLFKGFYISPNHISEVKQICLFDMSFDFGSAVINNIETLFRMARSKFLFLHDAVIANHTALHTFADLQSSQDYAKARKQIIAMFLYLREYLIWVVQPRYNWILPRLLPRLEGCLNGFRLFLQKIINLPEYILHHVAHSQGNKCMEASYHLFHGHLDLAWLHLTVAYQLMECRQCLCMDPAPASQPVQHSSASMSLDKSVRVIVADLVELAILRFSKVDVRSLLIRSPFNCNCVAELWVLLHLFTSNLSTSNKRMVDTLWTFVNKVLEDLLTGVKVTKTSYVTLVQSVTIPCANPHAFSLWLLNHLAMLFSHQAAVNCSNYPLLESIVKGIISSDVSESNMRTYLMFVEKILIRYWEPKTEVIILLWEYFQKRLNSTFYVPGESVNSVAIMSESVSGMVIQVKSRLTTNSHCEDSFQMFLRILGLHLQRVSGQAHHWNQLRGRVYSKLSTAKVQALNQVGLYHLASLFLTLAVTTDLSEVCKKLQLLLNCVTEESVSPLVWRTQLSMCLLSAERGMDFIAQLTPLTSILQDHPHLTKTYIEGIRDILEASTCVKVDHNIFIGNWIPRYLAECSSNEASRLLKVLHLIISRVQNLPLEQVKFQSSLWQYVGPYVKQKVSEESQVQLADVSLSLCLLSQGNCDVLREILNLFINNNTANIGVVRKFLSLLVQQRELLGLIKTSSPGSTDSYEVLIIKGWMRCSLVTVDWGGGSDLGRVTDYVTYLPRVAAICMDLPCASDPLTHFIVAISNKYRSAKDIFEKSSLRQMVSGYFTGIEKWVEPYVRQPTSPQITNRIYHIVGLVFSLIPSFIYIKSRPNTVLKGVLDVMFLPLNAYKPDFEPNPNIKAAIAANFHLYLKGLADLSMMQDSYIERCVGDLVRVYLPLVSSSGLASLLECVERLDRGSSLLLSTVCSAFIKRKACSPHPQCPQALRFLSSVAKTYSREVKIMMLLVDSCFEQVCDVVMFCDDFQPSKKIAHQFLVAVFESYSFGDEICNKIVEKFTSLCKDYLPFMPAKLFGLFHEVLQHRPELIHRFFPLLQAQVKIVETKRGITYDSSLRLHIEKLEKALDSLRNGTV